ncbi:putative nuclease HARBI1 [Anthonomus grandis grandis]|uniref:putative nuclease HARBI1 n=1 Tax=Anthonomus grandis grandis TaxID=2921223 RepID=UPI0021663820|nr:putative nuclease HARBI1 [Anthonomus grandis grandis]
MLPINVANILAAEEKERLEDLRLANLERRNMREESDPFSIEETRFKELFRINKDMARFLLNGILADLERGDRNSWLLGDSEYPQEPWLMTPIENALPESPEGRYTQAHIQTRNCVERCIGVLKGRFLCLSKVLRYSPEMVGQIFNACGILHNLCVETRLGIDFEVPQPQEPIYAMVPNNVAANNQEGNNARRNLINLYFRN